MITEPKPIKEFDGHGISGTSFPEFLGWLSTFMETSKEPTLLCGVLAHAAIWSLACHGPLFKVDPKDADIIRTPFGPMKMTVCKSIRPASILVNEGEAGEMLSTADNFQQINP